MADKKITELDATTSLISGDLIPVVTSASLTAVTMKTTIQSVIQSLINSEYVDQTGGTSDTYGAIIGSITGSNLSFTVSQNKYITKTLKVFLNGQLLTQGSSEDWVETSASLGVFSFISPPQSGDEITAVYWNI